MKHIKVIYNCLLGLLVAWFMYVPAETCKLFITGYPFVNHTYFVLGIFAIMVLWNYKVILGMQKQLLIVMAYCVFVILNTAIHGGDTNFAITMYARVMATVLFTYYIARRKHRLLIRGFSFGLNVLVVINLFSILFGTNNVQLNRLGNTYFLGFDNGNVLVVLPALVLNYLVAYTNGKGNKSFRIILSWVLTIVSIVCIDSATTTVGFACFVLFILFYKRQLYKLFNKKIVAGIIVLLFLSVVIFRVQYLFSDVIYTVLGRDATFTGRVALWNKALSEITDNILTIFVGHGVDPTAQRMVFFGVSSTHSEILDIAYQNGLIGFLLYSMVIYRYISKKNKAYGKERELVRTIDSSVYAFLIMMVVESYSSYIAYGLVFFLFTMSECINSNKLLDNKAKINTSVKRWRICDEKKNI